VSEDYEYKKYGKAMSKNQLRMMIALSDGPIQGIYNGPRPAVDYILTPYRWLGIREGNHATTHQTRYAKAQKALKALLKKGFVKEIRVPRGATCRCDYEMTKLGKSALMAQVDPDYRKKLRAMKEKHNKLKRQLILPWKKGANPEGLWPRWYSRKADWTVIYERDPTEGWQYMLVSPDGQKSPWWKSKVQEEKPTRREAEKAFWHNYKIYNKMREE